MRCINADELIMKDLGDDNYLVTSEAIANARTFEAEPVKHGHWNKIGNVWECSECGETISIRKYEEYRMNYCSNCGTKMDKEEE